ncbi:sterol desaturase family protein [Pseudenhygromyxa sp. WMMC2535]|uniref:sterol desaturase family protein n=1 Tax=Pseudenhygromyxa sp. WMMC2535 TaxID=2712867 RepID=UPI001552B9D9|nr:sterol desaturase family protein [Pseudenhygromyxa sp. WMMC2535]NVB42281.1 sterol desaturase family protein [Pseudenhygromyxa sp. WMMC2535]
MQSKHSSDELSNPGYEIHRKGSSRYFESDFFEFFSRCHGSVPLLVYGPIVLWVLYLSATSTSLSAGAIVGLVFLGVFVWSFAEYWLHRVAFHYQGLPRLHYIIHGYHHIYPNDLYRLVMPPGASAVPAGLFWGLAWLLFGYEVALPSFAGFAIGYLWYDMTHWWTHAGRARTRWGRMLRRHHMLHHFKDHEQYFGVSSPLWDYVFGTVPRDGRR